MRSKINQIITVIGLLGSISSIIALFSLSDDIKILIGILSFPLVASVLLILEGLEFLKSPIIVVNAEHSLDFSDRNRVVSKRTQKIKPLSTHVVGLEEIIKSEGSIENIKASISGLKSKVEEQGGTEIRYLHHFDSRLFFLKSYERIFEWDYVDSYLSDIEFHKILVYYPTKAYNLTLSFDENKSPKKIEVREEKASALLKSFVLNEHLLVNGHKIFQLKLNYPKIGHEFKLVWEW